MITPALYALFLFTPAAIIVACQKLPIAAKAGPIVLCYAAGLLLGLSGLLPEEAAAPRKMISEVSLALALPLLLFSVDVRAWGQLAGRAMLSMGCAIAAVVTLSTALYYIFSAKGVAQAEQLSGLAVGMYTGGVANLAAIQHALAVPEERFLLFATVDTVVGAVYLLFVLTLAPRLFAKLLPAFPAQPAPPAPSDDPSAPRPLDLRAIALAVTALIAAAVCVGLAVGLAPLFPFAAAQIVIIVLLTSFGILASFLPPLRNNAYATPMGMFLIYVFSFCVAASMDLGALAQVELSILWFVILATFGSLTLHAVFCRLLGIDRDTFLITSTAALMSPAFVPMVARTLGNPAILMSGMATGILGFALGNYLGIATALLLAP